MSTEACKLPIAGFDIDKPLWDQNTFTGRLKHFFWVTDPRSIIVPTSKLYSAKKLVEDYRIGAVPPGTTKEQLVYAKKLFESSFHPDSGELQNVIGRMSCQVPGGMVITGAMLQWYKTNTAVIFWQWVNQSFNALVNYTNRNAKSDITNSQIAAAYVSATGSALVVSLGLKTYLAKAASPFLQRYVPFAAVASANMVNIPLMRQRELTDGVMMFDENGAEMVASNAAAVKGITQVVTSRIIMAAPGMTLLPIVMERFEKKPWMQRIKPLHGPIQILGVGVCLLFMTPFSCSIFNQRCSIATSRLKSLDKDAYNALLVKTNGSPPEVLYFNKGL
ncbi:sideroflexin-2-like [Watersipora subatra]|uniref:sideroflexin-2-like n=1 Tax=Watersipora subatra TaxID=2589382 RepID=UPI00355BBA7D